MAYLSQARLGLRRNAVLSGLRWLPNSWQAKAWEPARTRHFGMDADKSAGSGFGRTECGAKPEPQGCGEPIQRPRTAIYALGQHLNQATA